MFRFSWQQWRRNYGRHRGVTRFDKFEGSLEEKLQEKMHCFLKCNFQGTLLLELASLFTKIILKTNDKNK